MSNIGSHVRKILQLSSNYFALKKPSTSQRVYCITKFKLATMCKAGSSIKSNESIANPLQVLSLPLLLVLPLQLFLLLPLVLLL